MSAIPFAIILQCVIALGLLNVWLVRAKSPTSYRGGESRSLKEEFEAYGLGAGMFYLVGVLKVGAAVALIAGIWIDALVVPAAGLLVFLMAVAIAMHIKVKDPARKSLPAAVMLVLSVSLCAIAMA